MTRSRCPASLGIVIPGLLAIAVPTAAQADNLTVTVENVHDARGHVRIGVCTRPQFLSEHCQFHAVVPSAPGRVVARIPVQPGTYAVLAYQDATDAGHLRRSLLGIPSDGIGISRDPKPHFGPPSFAESAVRIGPGDHAITIALHYY